MGRANSPLSKVFGLGTATVLLAVALSQGVFFPSKADCRELREAQPFTHDPSRGLSAAAAAAGTGPPEDGSCAPEEAQHLAQRFLTLKETHDRWSACAQSQWLDELHKLSPTGPKTFFDIGCNKGYTSARFFGLWAPEVGLSPSAIKARRPEVDCGACDDCKEQVSSSVGESNGEVRVFCFEPSQANFAQLVLTRDAFFKGNKPSVQWLTMNLAASNSTGAAQFSRQCMSDERCSLGVSSTGGNFDLIYTTTVDAFLAQHSIERVDVLKIDTEGFDATVIQGAMASLSRGTVGVLLFEYHRLGVWNEYKLQHVVEWLAGFGYVCYFDGQPTLARLTGCWDDLYEIKSWSNVVCVLRSHQLYPAMERMSLRHEAQQAAAGEEAQQEEEQEQQWELEEAR